jgi:hypothetical protein
MSKLIKNLALAVAAWVVFDVTHLTDLYERVKRAARRQ